MKPEQFELKVEGKPQPISVFERVTTGTAQEAKAQASLQGNATNSPANTISTTSPERTIIFFMDDFHLSAKSVDSIRKAILQFVDNEMAPNDQVLIISATGQIGVLAQLTDNKAVLRAAVSRLSYKQFQVRDNENIAMTEYQAIRVTQGDRDAGEQMQFSVDRRFKRSARMSILAFIYNAARGSNGAPDLMGQIQVLRDGRPVLSSPQRAVGVEGLDDQGRIPFGSDLSLSSLSAGYYTLLITVMDKTSQTSATQRLGFEVL